MHSMYLFEREARVKYSSHSSVSTKCEFLCWSDMMIKMVTYRETSITIADCMIRSSWHEQNITRLYGDSPETIERQHGIIRELHRLVKQILGKKSGRTCVRALMFEFFASSHSSSFIIASE